MEFLQILYLICVLQSAHSYNISPLPNLVLHEHKTGDEQDVHSNSTYFGYTLVLRERSILVGAPRAGSQANGVIYKCNALLQSTTDCAPYIWEELLNLNYTYHRTEDQWLGASMDGGARESEQLVLCAPRLVVKPDENDWFLEGACYSISDTLAETPSLKLISAAPFNQRQYAFVNGTNKRIDIYQMREHGISAHVAADGEELLTGAPGVRSGRGAVVHTISELQSYVSDAHALRLEKDSYFGFAVSSGYLDSTQPKRLLYVATAPRAQGMLGEVYLFGMHRASIEIISYVMRGTQFGEFFGYAVLTEDVNGDGLVDVLVAAPFYSINGLFEEGAIYVFMNRGSLNFERILLISPVSGNARFGITLTKLGDINQDGYNDIAVGAPFVNDTGAVFVYLGCELGLREKPSQVLSPPADLVTSFNADSRMFGFGISKGVDIDDNGFNDLAIGAPNAEAVYVYRTYPVVHIIATINAERRELKPKERNITIRVCYMIATRATKIQNQLLDLSIIADSQLKRVQMTNSLTQQKNFKVNASTENQCQVFNWELKVMLSDLAKPIDIELNYKLANAMPQNTTEFCENCAAVEPTAAKRQKERLVYITGCAGDVCFVDLQIKSENLQSTFVLGSQPTLSVTYTVSNRGENAYLSQINITSSNRMPFAKTPPNCWKQLHALICNLNGDNPLSNETISLTVSYDTSGITGQSMILSARVMSSGKQMSVDNAVEDVVTLTEFTEIEATCKTFPAFNITDSTELMNNVNVYELKSHGPSTVEELEIIFSIPVAMRIKHKMVTIIDITNVQAVYDGQIIAAVVEKNPRKEIALMQQQSIPSTENTLLSRRRREETTITPPTKSCSGSWFEMLYELNFPDIRAELPANRTIILNCTDSELTACAQVSLKVFNLKPDQFISIYIPYKFELDLIEKVLHEPWEYLMIRTALEVRKGDDRSGETLCIFGELSYNLIRNAYVTPIWVYIVSVLAGLLAMASITYGMYRAGFFRRTKKEELKILKRQSQKIVQEYIDEVLKAIRESESDAESLDNEKNNSGDPDSCDQTQDSSDQTQIKID